VQQKQQEKWCTGDWLLYHYNASTHSALTVQEFLAINSTAVLYHPYCSDLAPCNFFLFPKLKLALKERYDDIIMIQNNHRIHLLSSKQDFSNCFQQWSKHWAHCIKLQGNYFKRGSVEQ
jgi:hypothetical protein